MHDSPCALNGHLDVFGAICGNGIELSMDEVDGDILTAGGIELSADRTGDDMPTACGSRDVVVSISVPRVGVVDLRSADCAIVVAFTSVVIGELLDVVACVGLKKLRMSQLLPAIEADLFGGISNHLRGVTVRAMESQGSFRTG